MTNTPLAKKEDALFAAIQDSDFVSGLEVLRTCKGDEISTTKSFSNGSDSGNLLYLAAYKSPPYEFVQAMLDYGFDVNSRSNFTALTIAAWNGATDMVQCLIDNNVDPSITTDGVKTVLDYLLSPEGRGREKTHASTKMILDYAERGFWTLTGPQEISCIRVSQRLQRQVIDVFNFEYQERTTYTERLVDKTELSPVREGFNKSSSHIYIQKAIRKFEELSGIPPENNQPFDFKPKGRTKPLALKVMRKSS
jgi:ankyrin repeat protein